MCLRPLPHAGLHNMRVSSVPEESRLLINYFSEVQTSSSRRSSLVVDPAGPWLWWSRWRSMTPYRPRRGADARGVKHPEPTHAETRIGIVADLFRYPVTTSDDAGENRLPERAHQSSGSESRRGHSLDHCRAVASIPSAKTFGSISEFLPYFARRTCYRAGA